MDFVAVFSPASDSCHRVTSESKRCFSWQYVWRDTRTQFTLHALTQHNTSARHCPWLKHPTTHTDQIKAIATAYDSVRAPFSLAAWPSETA